jgi:NAD(P)H dehydrogenase (quinone)
MRRALDGTTTLFLVSGRESADRVAEHVTAVDAAVAADVERIVYLSFTGAAPDATFTFARDHWHTEQHIRGTGLRFTFLRDNLYQAEFAVFAGPNGVIRGPAEDGRAAAVAHDDVADVAAVVLVDEAAGPGGHDGATYDITGPAALSLQDAAAELSRVTGRTIRYLPETEEEAYESRSGYGAPEFEVAGWVTTYLAIATGELSTVSDTVERLTGHPSQQFAEFLRANPWSYQRLIA